MFTYIPSTDAGKVRMLITDRDEDGATFQDEEIQAFLDMNLSSVRLAAAQALETIAANEVLVQKRIETLSLKTDGPKEAEQLIALAKSLREQENNQAGFDIAEMVEDPFSARERWRKQWQREDV